MPAVESPEIPDELTYLYEIYREIKFARIHKDERFLLVPRKMLNYQELDSFSKLSGFSLSSWEVSTIMNIDGIFEHSRGG